MTENHVVTGEQEQPAHRPSFTPGPWSFDHDWARIPTIFGSDRSKVASVEKNFDNKGDVLPQHRGDANLIATAPELLALAKRFEHNLTRILMKGFLDETADRLREDIRAVIAKAESQ